MGCGIRTSMCVHASPLLIISIFTVPFLYLDVPIYDIHSMQYDPPHTPHIPPEHVKHCQTAKTLAYAQNIHVLNNKHTTVFWKHTAFLTGKRFVSLISILLSTQQLMMSWRRLSVGCVVQSTSYISACVCGLEVHVALWVTDSQPRQSRVTLCTKRGRIMWHCHAALLHYLKLYQVMSWWMSPFIRAGKIPTIPLPLNVRAAAGKFLG